MFYQNQNPDTATAGFSPAVSAIVNQSTTSSNTLLLTKWYPLKSKNAVVPELVAGFADDSQRVLPPARVASA
jgi:hypothetical protein